MPKNAQIYKSAPLPQDLTFDEASLFWRLKMGEGIPTRKWHKPLDRSKTWHQIKAELDEKLEISKSASIFQKIYPSHGAFLRFFSKMLKVIKQSFLFE